MKIVPTSHPEAITAADVEIGEYCLVGRERVRRIVLPSGMVKDDRLTFINECGVLQLYDRKTPVLIAVATVPFGDLKPGDLFITSGSTVFAKSGLACAGGDLNEITKKLHAQGQGSAMRMDDGSLHVFAFSEGVRPIDGELRFRPLAGVTL
jgi:hypothetical protein